MAPPTRTEVLSNFIVSTGQNRRPGIADAFFNSSPVWQRLYDRESVILSGGSEIRENFIYTGFPASSYGRGDLFDTTTTEFSTSMLFDWKFVYSPLNLNVIDVELNDSPEQTFDLVEAAMETCELSLIEDLSTQIFADGTGNGGKDFDGLANGVARTGTYGGITRGSTANSPGAAIRCAVDDTTGGALSLANVNFQFGSCIVGREKPDLIVTTQTLWNRIWERLQPQDRYNGAPEDRDAGMEMFRFNGATVTVDSHCPSGFLYFLNTKWWRLYLHRRYDFRYRGPMEPTNQQMSIGQLITWGNLVCRSPRMQGRMSGLS